MKFAKEMKIRLHMTEETLSISPGDTEILDNFIASNAPDAPTRAEEIEAIGVADYVDKRRMVFPVLEDGTPFFWNYQIKGFFKDSAKMLLQLTERREVEVVKKDGTVTKKKQNVAKNETGRLMTNYNYKTKIDGLLFVLPRKVSVRFKGGIGDCQRVMRTDSFPFPRVALAGSDSAPAGSIIDLRIGLMDAAFDPFVRECLDYGEIRGLGGWRNSGKGTFLWEELDDDGYTIGGNYEELREMYF